MTDEADDDRVVHLDARMPWQQRCQKDARGKMYSNHHNAMQALSYAHELRDVFAFDEMAQAVTLQHEIGLLDTCDRWLTEYDVIDIAVWLQHAGMVNMSIDIARSAIRKRAQNNRFHPLRDYLHSLEWDHVPRIGTWLTSYLGAPLGKYEEHIGRMFLTSMVARIIEPGCQADYMLILEGPQGELKSSACRVLGGRWFSDHLPPISSSSGSVLRASQHLRGKWLIEVSELHAMSEAKTTHLKSFITRTHERYIPLHAREELNEPRSCCFVGTTNQNRYLKDTTGGRRFWPVKIGVSGRIELELLAERRDQLFAEAMWNYQCGHQWWPDPTFEVEVIKPQQDERQEGHIWDERIAEYLAGKPRTTIAQVAIEGLGLPNYKQGQREMTDITDALRRLEWREARSNKGRWWEPIAKHTVTAVTGVTRDSSDSQ